MTYAVEREDDGTCSVYWEGKDGIHRIDADVIYDTGDYYVKPKDGYAVWFRGRTTDWQVGLETYTDLDDALRMAYWMQRDEDMREKEGL